MKVDKKVVQDLYKSILTPRLIEEKMLNLLRQGKLSKWFSGIGQEAISVGVTKALKANDTIFTMHRNLGVFTSRNIPLENLFGQIIGNELGFTKGRDRSFHFGIPEYNIIGMISHLAAMLPVACGSGLGYKLKKQNRIAVAFVGDGATSEGDFHEALNLAAVWKLPVIFIIENNGYAMGTSVDRTSNVTELYKMGLAYDIPSQPVDAMNVIKVHRAISKAANRARNGKGPSLLEFRTYRYKGHSMSDPATYRSKKELESYKDRDPIEQIKKMIILKKILSLDEINIIDQKIKDQVKKSVEFSETSSYPGPEDVYSDIYVQKDYPFIRE